MKYLIVFGVALIYVGFSSALFLVSEVLVDGSNEYVEVIYQGDDPYQGELTLEGIKSSPLTYEVTVAPGDRIVVGDSLDQLVQHVCQTFSSQGLSLTDSAPVDITVSWLGGSHVSGIDASVVVAGDNLKRSFVLESGELSLIQDFQSQNTTLGWFGSPCLSEATVQDTTGSQDEEQEENQDLSDEESGGEQQEAQQEESGEQEDASDSDSGSGSVYTGDVINPPVEEDFEGGMGTEGEQEAGIPLNEEEEEDEQDEVSSIDDEDLEEEDSCESSLSPGSVRIEAVLPRNGTVAEELLVLRSDVWYEGPLILVGGGRGQASLSLSVSLEPGVPVVVASEYTGFADTTIVYEQSSLSLTDGGETLTLQSADGTILDQVYRSRSSVDEMLGGNEVSDGTLRELSRSRWMPELFGWEGWIDCSFRLEDTTLQLSDPTLCAFPGEHHWMINDQHVASCDDEILLDLSPLDVSFVRTIGTTELCSSEFSYTYSSESGGSDTGTVMTGTMATGSFWISEIQPHDEYFPEYVEIYFSEPFQGELAIEGIGQGTATKQFVVDVNGGEYRIITDRAIDTLPPSQQVVLSSISLTNGGETLTVRQGGQVMDIVSYQALSSDVMSFTRSGFEQVFEEELQTPGFDMQRVHHLLPEPGEEEFSCAIRTQATAPFYHTNKLNLVSVVGDKDIANSTSTYTCVWNREGMTYESNQIEESRCNPGYLSIPEHGIYEVSLVMQDNQGRTCTTSTTINAPIKTAGGGGSSSAGNSTYYQGLYQKRKGRFELLSDNIKPFGLSTNASGSVVTQAGSSNEAFGEGSDLQSREGQIRIVKLMPNPSGSDTDNEKIVLENLTDDAIDLAGWKINNGKSNKYLPELLLPAHETITITASLGLVNTSRCVAVVDDTSVYARFCYGEASDDQRFDQSSEGMLALQDSAGGIELGALDLKHEDDEVCLYHQSQSVMCLPMKISQSELKQLASDAKKVASMQKKYDKELERRKRYQQDLADQKKKTTKTRKDYQKKVEREVNKAKAYRDERDYHKRLGSASRGLISLWYGELRGEREPLFVGSSLESSRDAYQASRRAIMYGGEQVTYGPVSFGSTDISSIHAFLEGSATRTSQEALSVHESRIHLEPTLRRIWSGSRIEEPMLHDGTDVVYEYCEWESLTKIESLMSLSL